MRLESLISGIVVTGMVVLAGGSARAGEDKTGDWAHLNEPGDWQGTDGWEFDGGSIYLPEEGGGYIWTQEKYEDFVLEVEYNTTGNSGIFFRSSPDNPAHGGFEFQVKTRPDKNDMGRHDVGALYDVKAPKTNAAKDGWNKVRIKCEGPMMAAWLNGQKLWEVDISRWTEAKQNPDGSDNKFNNPLAELARKNHIGFQDHSHPVRYRNVRIKRLGQ